MLRTPAGRCRAVARSGHCTKRVVLADRPGFRDNLQVPLFPTIEDQSTREILMLCRPMVLLLCLFCLERMAPAADEPTDALFKEITAISRRGATASPAARAAWDKLVARGPAVLPRLLVAMDTSDTVVANWLRTAFDRIVTTEQKQGGKRIDADALLAYTRDPKRQGRARRLALGVVDQLRPGTDAKLIPGWLDDPEFRHDAVAVLIKEADALAKDGKRDKPPPSIKKRSRLLEMFRRHKR